MNINDADIFDGIEKDPVLLAEYKLANVCYRCGKGERTIVPHNGLSSFCYSCWDLYANLQHKDWLEGKL